MTSPQVVTHTLSHSGVKHDVRFFQVDISKTMEKKIQRVSIGARVHSKYFEGLGALSG